MTNNDLLDDVRRVREDVTFDAERLARTRATVMPAFQDKSQSRRSWAWGLSIGAVAVAAVGALVVAFIPRAEVVPVPQIAASIPVAPASPLQSSAPEIQPVMALAAAGAREVATREGEYRQITTTTDRLKYWSAKIATQQSRDPYDSQPWEAEAAWLAGTTRVTTVPVSGTGVWSSSWDGATTIGTRWGAVPSDVTTNHGEGDSWVSDEQQDELLAMSSWENMSAEPRTLLADIEAFAASRGWDETTRRGASPTELVLRTLESNSAPTQVRATLLEVAALLPGATVINATADEAHLRWKPYADVGLRVELQISLTTGYVMTADWWSGAPRTLVPDSVPDSHSEILIDEDAEAPRQ